MLLEGILSGQLSSGQELNEVSLAKKFGVSRTPVHEAIRQLTLEGLIEQTTANKSSVVALNSHSVREIYEMRKILEVAAVKRAACNIKASQLNKLIESAELLKCALEDDDWANQALDLDLKFHELIAEASGNKRLINEIGLIVCTFRFPRFSICSLCSFSSSALLSISSGYLTLSW